MVFKRGLTPIINSGPDSVPDVEFFFQGLLMLNHDDRCP